MSELYELPNEWEWKKLKDKEVCTLIMGQSPKSDTYNTDGNGIAFFQGKTEFGEMYPTVVKYCTAPKKIAEVGDILLSVRAPVGPTNIANIKCAIGRGLGAIRPNKDNTLTNYLLYFFRNFEIEISQKGKGSTFSAITKTELENIDIPLPPLQEQKRIVSKLDTLFEKIDKSIALHQKNMDEADVFMGSVLNDVFEELEEKHLPMKRFDTYTKLSRGHNPPKKDFIYENKDGYMRFIQIRDGSSDKNAVYVPITKKLHTVTKEDLLLVAYRQVGKVFRNMEGAFNVALCKIMNIDKNNLDTTYLYYLIQSKYVKGELLKRSERALIPSMSIEHLKSIEIPLPPLNIQQKTVMYLDEISQKIEKIKSVQKEKMESLVALKASILDQAFRGEL